jgi:hypothetical protein
MNSCIAPLAIRLAPRSLWLPFEMLFPKRTSSQGALHDQQSQPVSEFAPCFREHSDLLEPERCMQRNGGNILSTDARNHGVTSFQLTIEDQLSQKHGADPVAGTIGAHVN